MEELVQDVNSQDHHQELLQKIPLSIHVEMEDLDQTVKQIMVTITTNPKTHSFISSKLMFKFQ